MINIMNLLWTGKWSCRSCFIIGGGPSLYGFNFSKLDGCLTIGTNRVFEYFDPTILLAIDERFYRWVNEEKYGKLALSKFLAYKGIKVGVRINKPHIAGTYEVKGLGVSGPILPVEQGIYHGNNSGYSAVALALALGAETVYLLGVDMRYDGKMTHFHTGHPEYTQERELVKKCVPVFENLSKSEAGKRVKVINTAWPDPPFSRLARYFEVVPFPKLEGRNVT